MFSSLIKSMLHFGGALAFLRLAVAQSRAVVLRYHSVADTRDRTDLYLDPVLTVPPHVFEQQIQFLSRRYTIVPLGDIVRRLRQGRKLDPRALAITFDDGYRDNYTRAFPILCHYKVPATFYLTSGCIDNKQILWTTYLRYIMNATRVKELRLTQPERISVDLSAPGAKDDAFKTLVVQMKNISTPRRKELLAAVAERLDVHDTSPLNGIMMNWEEVREMQRHGMSLGAHTVTHPSLPNTSPEEAEREIRGSKEMIEGHLRERVLHFSYPNGRGSSHLTEQVKQLVRKAGFRSAVTSHSGCIQEGDDLFALNRVGIYRKHGRLSHLSWEVEETRWRG
ncbi:MAG: polysaccharide deacetylase family protein [Candidatus Binatia bacterium]